MSDDIEEERLRSRTEIRRWLAESDKFVAEQRKLMAEAAKFERERWTSVLLALAAVFGAGAGFLAIFARVMGWPT
jgi:hypothetical protein